MSANEEITSLREENQRLKKELEIGALDRKNIEMRLEAAKLAAERAQDAVKRPWILQKESWVAIGAAVVVLIPAYQQWSTARADIKGVEKQRDDARAELTLASNEKTNALREAKKAQEDKAKAEAEVIALQNSKLNVSKGLEELKAEALKQQEQLDTINQSITRLTTNITNVAFQLQTAQTKIKRPQPNLQEISGNVDNAYASIKNVEKEAKIITPFATMKATIPVSSILRQR